MELKKTKSNTLTKKMLNSFYIKKSSALKNLGLSKKKYLLICQKNKLEITKNHYFSIKELEIIARFLKKN